MFWRKKNRPWYVKTVAMLVVIRIIYGFACFFLKAAVKQSRPAKQRKKIPRKKGG